MNKGLNCKKIKNERMNGSSLQSGYMEDVDGKVCVKEVLVI